MYDNHITSFIPVDLAFFILSTISKKSVNQSFSDHSFLTIPHFVYLLHFHYNTCEEIYSISLNTSLNRLVESLLSNSNDNGFCNECIRTLSDWALPNFCLKSMYRYFSYNSIVYFTICRNVTLVSVLF